MTAKTRAVIASRPGGPEALQIVERPRPVPGEGEILVRVRAAGMNRMDVLQRQGNYPLPPDATDVLGVDSTFPLERLPMPMRAWMAATTSARLFLLLKCRHRPSLRHYRCHTSWVAGRARSATPFRLHDVKQPAA